MSPKISIVIPTYNQAQYIEETIESIQKQTFQDWELIIVDDGSTDKTKEILNKYAFHQFPRISVYYKENGGTGTALNLGFSKARGARITWLASDNGLYPTALEELHTYMDNHPACHFVYAECDVKTMDNDSKNVINTHSLKKELRSMEWDPYKFFECYNIGIVWLFSREFLQKMGPYQSLPCEDYTSVCNAILAGMGNTIRFLDKNLGWFRRHKENISARLAKDGYKYTKDLIQKMVNLRDEKFKEGKI